MSVLFLCESSNDLMTLLPCIGFAFLPKSSTRMSFVHNDHLRTSTDEVVAAGVGLDVVHGDDGEREDVEHGSIAADAVQPFGCSAKDQFRFDVEFFSQFFLPLFSEVWRAEDAETLDFGSIEEFTSDQQCFDGLANTDVVGNEHSNGILLESHQKWHKLVRSRFDGNTTERAERPSTGSEAQSDGVSQQLRRTEIAEL